VASRKNLLNMVADLASAIFREMCLVQNDGFQALSEMLLVSSQMTAIAQSGIPEKLNVAHCEKD
jgi:hypothetical protein